MALDLFENIAASPTTDYPFGHLLSHAAARQARALIASFAPCESTPLRDLELIASATGVRRVLYKDESARLGLGSIKALGAPHALARLLLERLGGGNGASLSIDDLVRDGVARSTTVVCATDGNHGLSLAAAAGIFGCSCVVFLHRDVSRERERAIVDRGASVVRVSGNYDDAVRASAEAARSNGWDLVSDTSWEGYERIPLDVMRGYSVMAMEVVDELRRKNIALPTHVFIQGGVGGIAAALVAYLWEEMSPWKPVCVVVEPEEADCLMQSAKAGRPSRGTGNLDTVMAGLSCGEASRVAWPILAGGVRFFMTIPDQAAIDAMKLLADGAAARSSIVAGESAAVGLAALLRVAESESVRAKLGLRADSTVLLVGTEGATDPLLYEKYVGRPPAITVGAVAPAT